MLEDTTPPGRSSQRLRDGPGPRGCRCHGRHGVTLARTVAGCEGQPALPLSRGVGTRVVDGPARPLHRNRGMTGHISRARGEATSPCLAVCQAMPCLAGVRRGGVTAPPRLQLQQTGAGGCRPARRAAAWHSTDLNITRAAPAGRRRGSPSLQTARFSAWLPLVTPRRRRTQH